ncbi:hypothetical protein [Psychrobacillus sp.]|uniref:hypothetical protein n=1 Tax=Psychrobacillus sp. TaxID=1871623 RepID=UPI0028BE6120|nr:hypothetical protein [Psychrobacillus sp.]
MKKSKVVVPIMIISAVLATFILNQNDYTEVTIINKVFIIAGASILSSVIGYFLLGADVDKVDPKPANSKPNKKESGK